MIDSLKEQYIGLWENTPDTFPVLREQYAVNRQKTREVEMSRFADEIILLIKGFPGRHKEDNKQWGSALKRLIYGCGTGVVGLGDSSMRILLDDGFCDVTSEFIVKAREFDAGFKTDEIFQSLRNAWIMNCIQKLMGSKVEMTGAVFAYSMLYPYSDNYIDEPVVSDCDKMELNKNFNRRLAGMDIAAASLLENKLFRLVGMIEGQFPRNKYPMVYESLLAIQTAQEKSLEQDVRKKGTDPDIFAISVEKGGSSVLADGCLIKGSLSAEEAAFVFGFGVLLQLLDDMQDAAEDRRCGHKTLFSMCGTDMSAQRSTNRLINFTMNFLDSDKCFNSNDAKEIKSLMKKSILFLLMGAVACNGSMYDTGYLKRLEAYSPLRFNYLKGFYKRMGREFGRLKLKMAVQPLEIPMARAFASGTIS